MKPQHTVSLWFIEQRHSINEIIKFSTSQYPYKPNGWLQTSEVLPVIL